MDKTVLFPHEIALLALRKAEAFSRDFALKAKYFAQEVIAGGGVTALGRHSERVRKKYNPVFAFFNKISTALTFAILSDIEQTARQAETARVDQSINMITTSAPAPVSTEEEQSCLVNEFTETVFVSDEVYNALHQQTTVLNFQEEISNIETQIKNALDENFTGPLTAEFEAVRQDHNHCAFPLTCEFKAHAKLAEKGIAYSPLDKTFTFPEDMVTELCHNFKGSTSPDAYNRPIRVFTECKVQEPAFQERAHLKQSSFISNLLNLTQQKGGSYAPAPAYA